MGDLSQFSAGSADWRRQLKLNNTRTVYVIAMYLAIYIAIGLLIDTYLYLGTFPEVAQIVQALLTLQITPYATLLTAGIALFSLVVTYSQADSIMLAGTDYYQVTPETARTLTERQLYNVVEEMKVAAGLRFMPKVYLIQAPYMNAFASGYSEHSAMVAITQGLLEKLDREEMQAVMAHELSHIRHQDIRLTLTASVLSNWMLILIDILFYNVIYFGNNDRRGNNQLAFIIILLRYLLPLITVVLMLYLSRTREYMADAGCVELMRNNEPLARALLKIHQDYQSHKDAYSDIFSRQAHEDVRRPAYLYDPFQNDITWVQSITSMFSTHPSLEDRLAALGYKRKAY